MVSRSAVCSGWDGEAFNRDDDSIGCAKMKIGLRLIQLDQKTNEDVLLYDVHFVQGLESISCHLALI